MRWRTPGQSVLSGRWFAFLGIQCENVTFQPWLKCQCVDLSVKAGVMEVNTMALETEIRTVVVSGQIDLKAEMLDLTLVPTTRATSPVALRSPIHVTGPFAKPAIQLDVGRVAVRGIGAVALGLINPLLALIPLVEMGPGVESQC
jgi:uncharacterized protein involved in outer membrane biogenesis